MATKKLIKKSSAAAPAVVPRSVPTNMGQLKPCTKCQMLHSRRSEYCQTCVAKAREQRKNRQINVRQSPEITALMDKYNATGYEILRAGVKAIEFLQARVGEAVVEKLVKSA